MSSDLNRTAALLRFGVVHRLVSVPEVVAWADAEIEARPHPPHPLLELSLAERRPDELIVHLGALADGVGEAEIMDDALGLMNRALLRDREMGSPVARVLFQLAAAGVLPGGNDAEARMMYFDDALDLAASGTFGSKDEVLGEMLEFLAPYAAGPGRDGWIRRGTEAA